MIMIFEKRPPFECIYTESFALICKSFALIRESYAFIRESFALIRESYAFIRESYAFIRESFALIRESDAFICESFALIRENKISLRKWAQWAFVQRYVLDKLQKRPVRFLVAFNTLDKFLGRHAHD